MTDETPHRPYVTTIAEFDVSNDDQSVAVRKLKTRKGERVEFDSPSQDTSLRVDALGIESLAWQETDVVSQFSSDGEEMDLLDEESESVVCDAEFELTNEYAHVLLQRLHSPTGAALRIRAPKKREQLQIDVNGLAGLARQDHTLFSQFLEQPHGPEDHH